MVKEELAPAALALKKVDTALWEYLLCVEDLYGVTSPEAHRARLMWCEVSSLYESFDFSL